MKKVTQARDAYGYGHTGCIAMYPLMTKTLERLFAKLGPQRLKPEGEQIVLAHFFCLGHYLSFLATDWDKDLQTFYGCVLDVRDGKSEMRFFSADELLHLRGACMTLQGEVPNGMPFQRETHWRAQPLMAALKSAQSDVRKEAIL